MYTLTGIFKIYDPVNERRGLAAIRNSKNGTDIYLQLQPGQSCILTCAGKIKNKAKWDYLQTFNSDSLEIKGPWLLTPKSGAPEIPDPVTLQQPGSWTLLGGQYETFCGKAIYSNSFEVPNELLSKGFLLDLGDVRETAKVKINGKEIGLLWCLPNRVLIPKGVIKQKNTIEIEVTNLSFNRVVQLDQDEVKWKNFYNINFVDIHYKPFDASSRMPEDSGLLSKIFLINFSPIEF